MTLLTCVVKTVYTSLGKPISLHHGIEQIYMRARLNVPRYYSIMGRIKRRHRISMINDTTTVEKDTKKDDTIDTLSDSKHEKHTLGKSKSSNLVHADNQTIMQTMTDNKMIQQSFKSVSKPEQPISDLQDPVAISNAIKTHFLTAKPTLRDTPIEQLRLPKVVRDFEQPPDPYLHRVTILGRPNAGKSTLVNALVGQNVSATSTRAHTTRGRIHAVLTEGQTQVVFLDTPGVATLTGNIMNRDAARELMTSPWRSLDGADSVLMVIDAERSVKAYKHALRQEQYHQTKEANDVTTESQPKDILRYLEADDTVMVRRLAKTQLPVILLINKIDLLDQPGVFLPRVEQIYREALPNISSVIMISALNKIALEEVKLALFARARPRPWMFPADMVTDLSDVVRIEQAVSAALYERLRSYLPYSIRVKTVEFDEQPGVEPNAKPTIFSRLHILVPRDSQKKIVIGRHGQLIQDAQKSAVKQLTEVLKRKVHLILEVKALS